MAWLLSQGRFDAMEALALRDVLACLGPETRPAAFPHKSALLRRSDASKFMAHPVLRGDGAMIVSTRAVRRAFPRFLALWTNWKKARQCGSFPWLMPRYGRSHERKFGLSFEIIDPDRISHLRQSRGFSVNPRATGSRFIISHSLLIDGVYASGLRDMLGEFRARALFILDEAHHAAPSAGTSYAISSQLTKAVRNIGDRFGHRRFPPRHAPQRSFQQLFGTAGNA